MQDASNFLTCTVAKWCLAFARSFLEDDDCVCNLDVHSRLARSYQCSTCDHWKNVYCVCVCVCVQCLSFAAFLCVPSSFWSTTFFTAECNWFASLQCVCVCVCVCVCAVSFICCFPLCPKLILKYNFLHCWVQLICFPSDLALSLLSLSISFILRGTSVCEIRLNTQVAMVSTNFQIKLPLHNFCRHTYVQAHKKWIKQTHTHTHTHTHNAPLRKLSLSHFLKLNCQNGVQPQNPCAASRVSVSWCSQASLMHVPSQTGFCARFCRSNGTTHKTLRHFRSCVDSQLSYLGIIQFIIWGYISFKLWMIT